MGQRILNCPSQPDSVVPQNLFRSQVLENQGAVAGDLADISLPLRWRWLSAASLLLVGLIATVVVFGSYAPRHVAPGYLETREASTRVYATLSGRVEVLHVRHGDKVDKGDLLATVAAHRTLGGNTSVESEVLMAMQSEDEALGRQIAAATSLAASEENRLKEFQLALSGRLHGLLQQTDIVARRLRLAERIAGRATVLADRGYVARQDMDRADAEVLALRQARHAIENDIDTLRAEIAAGERALKELPLRSADRLAELQRQRQRLQQRVAEVRNRQSQQLVSPVAGYISVFDVAVGHEVNARSPLFTVTPTNLEPDKLYAVVYVPSRAAGNLQPGGGVQLRFDAFPYQQYGIHPGRITEISSLPSLPSEISQVLLREPAYRLRVELAERSANASFQRTQLRPGMTLQADVMHERRSIAAWLFEPLLTATSSATGV